MDQGGFAWGGVEREMLQALLQMRAVRREREGREGGIATQIRKQPSHPVPRGQTLPSTHAE